MGIDVIREERERMLPMVSGVAGFVLGLLYIHNAIPLNWLVILYFVGLVVCVVNVINDCIYFMDTDILENICNLSWPVSLLVFSCKLLGVLRYLWIVSLLFLVLWYFGVYKA